MIRIPRAESPPQSFIGLIVSVFQCDRDIAQSVRASVSFRSQEKRPAASEPFPLSLSSSAPPRAIVVFHHTRVSLSLYEIIARRRRRTNRLMRGKERRERCGRPDEGREAHSNGTSFSRSGSCCGPKHKTTQSNTTPSYISFIITRALFFVSLCH